MSKPKNSSLQLLSSPSFFPEWLGALRKTGLVGEAQNALAIYIVATSRLLSKPLCLFVKGPSSVGKNYLTDKVLGFIPSSAVQLLTSSSNRSWNYMGQKLSHKVVYVKERNDLAGAVHPARVLISEKELVHWVTEKRGRRFIQRKYVTKGPISAISTTTKDRVEVDDESRHISIWLDESAEQTTRVMQAAVDELHGQEPNDSKVWHAVQRIIEKRAAVPIELPDWFEDLVQYVRNDVLWARRYFPAFLQACRTVALIRSFGRKAKNTRKRITVRFSDFAVTALIFNSVLDDSIDRADDQDLEVQQDVRRISFRKKKGVSAADLVDEKGISYHVACSLLRKAASAGTIVRANQPSKGNLKLYLPAKVRAFLPDPAEVFQKLESLPERVKFVHPVTGEWVTYSRKRRD
jgi:hypothetical protein